jgi:ELWxxDGT repeat protein
MLRFRNDYFPHRLVARVASLAVAVLLVGSPSANAQRLVADINATGVGSGPTSFLVGADKLFFVADDGKHGKELWISDGTEAGTRLLVDATPGPTGSVFRSMLQVAGSVVFILDDQRGRLASVDEHGVLRSVLDLPNGAILSIAADSDRLYAITWETTRGLLNAIDLTTGVSTEIELDAGSNAEAEEIVFVEDTPVIIARTHDRMELWKLDPVTNEATRFFESETRSGRDFRAAGDKLYFKGFATNTGQELWVSDLTTDGTKLALDLTPGDQATDFEFMGTVGNKVVICAMDGDRLFGYEPWISDGTEAGTYLVLDVRAGPRSSIRGNEAGGTAGSRLVFPATTEELGGEMWVTDGTGEGTLMLKDINSGLASSDPAVLGVFAESVVFSAVDVEHGRELWLTDGTSDGTRLVADAYPGFADGLRAENIALTSVAMHGVMNGVMYFGGSDEAGRELWRSDGTHEGTWLVKDIRTDGTLSSSPGELLFDSGQLYFTANDGHHGNELWVTDVSSEDPRLVVDLFPGSAHSILYRLATTPRYVLGDVAGVNRGRIVKAVDRHSGDATSILLGPSDRKVPSLRAIPFGDRVLYSIDVVDETRELWITDGTQEGTSLLRKGVSDSGPLALELASVDGRLLFFDDDELFTTDGTIDNTMPLAGLERDYVVDPKRRGASYSTTMDGVVYFKAGLSNNDSYLWRTDWTPEGTWKVGIQPLERSSEFTDLVPHRSRVYFAATTSVHGRELWQSDGSKGGMELLVDIYPGPESSAPGEIVSVRDNLVFAANDASHGRELWTSDGGADGTRIVADVADGPSSSDPVILGTSDHLVFFSADDGLHGRELWMYDAWSEDVVLLADLVPGSASSNPKTMTVGDGEAYFVATTPETGKELWRINLFQLTTGIDEIPAVSTTHTLSPVYPNPFATQAQFELSVAHDQDVTISVFDALGRRVATLHNGPVAASHPKSFTLPSRSWADGLYFIKVGGQDFTATQSLVLLR